MRELQREPQRFDWWMQHVQTILEDARRVDVAERPEDRALYLIVTYRNGIAVPAWLLSDGALRLLALTLLAYPPNQDQGTQAPKERFMKIKIYRVYRQWRVPCDSLTGSGLRVQGTDSGVCRIDTFMFINRQSGYADLDS